MKKALYYIYIGIILLSSCSKNKYLHSEIDETFIEFQSPNSNTVIPYNVSEIFEIQIPLQLFGNKLTSTSEVHIQLSQSNAIANTQFTLDSIIQIPANTILDTLRISVLIDKIIAGKNYTFLLKLSSFESNLKVSENYGSCLVSFSKEKFIDFFTGNYSCFESSTNTNYDVTFSKINDSTVSNNNFWDFPYEGELVDYTFRQDNNTVIIKDSEWIDKMGNLYEVSGTGTFSTNGNFIVDFYLKNESGEVYQSGQHTFTKR